MVFVKGGPQPVRPQKPKLEVSTRLIVHAKCLSCSYERCIDSAYFPDLDPRLVRETGRSHAQRRKHEMVVSTQHVVQYHGKG